MITARAIEALPQPRQARLERLAAPGAMRGRQLVQHPRWGSGLELETSYVGYSRSPPRRCSPAFCFVFFRLVLEREVC